MFATTWHVVAQRRLAEPPATLWRVEHSGNQDSVFSSRATPQFASDLDFAETKRQHLNWYSKQASPFLSTFSHQGHALNWARQRVTLMHDPCVQVHEIDTQGLLVFGAGGDEFLVLDEIPLTSVMHTTSMRLPPVGRNRRRRARGPRSSTPYARPEAPKTFETGYVAYVGGGYSDDTTSSDDSFYGY